MKDGREPKKPASSLGSLGLLAVVVGIGGGGALQSQQYEGPLRDVARLLVLAGIVILIVAAVQKRRAG